MRILVINDYYGPCEYGWGYRQLCEEVTDGLAERGHDLAVLTSTYVNGVEPKRRYPVLRRLPLDPDWHSGVPTPFQFFAQRRRKERNAVSAFRAAVVEFKPDLIFVWHGIGIPRLLLREAEHQPGIPLVYYLADFLPELPDEYVAYWRKPAQSIGMRIAKPMLTPLALRLLKREGKPIQLEFRHTVCVSDYVRRRLLGQDLIGHESTVIHNGVDLEVFHRCDQAPVDFSVRPLSCVIAGRLVPEKGIQTALQAFAHLRSRNSRCSARLTIVGGGEPRYVRQLESMTARLAITDMVTFEPPVARAEMPPILARHQVLILPSECEEALARSIQEGMAMGLLAIGTTTGGSGELLVDRETGLAFETGNAEDLASQIGLALDSPEISMRLAWAGQNRVKREFDISLTIQKIENHLSDLVDSARADHDGVCL